MKSLDLLIERLDGLVRERRPELHRDLQPPATEEALTAAEAYYGFALPVSLRTLARWRNGQGPRSSESFTGFDNLSLMSLEAGMEAHRVNQELDRAGEFPDPAWWLPSWVPVFANGGGDHVCLEVGDGGRDGGLLWYFHDHEDRPMPELSSLEAVLEAAIEHCLELQAPVEQQSGQ